MRVSPPPADPESFLKWSMDVYGSLRSFRCAGTWTLAFPERASPSRQPTLREILFVAPNKFRVTSGQASPQGNGLIHHYTCDGERFLIWPEGYPTPATYASVPEHFSKMGFGGGAMGHPFFGGSCLYTFFGGSKLADDLQKNERKPGVTLHYGEEEMLDGVPCRTLVLSGGAFNDERRISISTIDGLVRRIQGITHARKLPPEERRINAEAAEAYRNSDSYKKLPAKMKHGALDGFNRTQIPRNVTEENYTGFVLNAPIPAATFDTRLPAS